MIGRLWRRQRLLLVAFVLAALVAAVLTVRSIVFAIHWSDPARRDLAVDGWMTPRFVAHSWSVPPEIIADALELAQDGATRGMTLAEIAEARNVPLEVLVADVAEAIEAFRAAR